MEIKSTRETKTVLLWKNLNNFPDKTDLDFGSLTTFVFYENIKTNYPNNVRWFADWPHVCLLLRAGWTRSPHSG